MTNKTLSVIARIIAKAGKELELEAALRSLLEPTRREVGCVNYDLHVNADSRGEFWFYENWTSEQDLANHLQSEHILALRSRGAELIEGEAEIIRCWKVL